MAPAAAAAKVSDDGDHPVLGDDERGIPRSLPLLAALVEASSLRHAAEASRPAGSDLVRAFRGGAAPAIPIAEFLERVHEFIRREGVRHVILLHGASYVLAGIYLTRFMRSAAARQVGILVDPSTAHRLVAVALFVGAKFGGPDDNLPRRWTIVFETGSDLAIRASEMAGLEERFLRAVDYRLFVDHGEFQWFCGVLERAPRGSAGAVGSRKRPAASAVEAEREDGRHRVRACLPAPVQAEGEDNRRRVRACPPAPVEAEGEDDRLHVRACLPASKDDRHGVRACLPAPAVVAN